MTAGTYAGQVIPTWHILDRRTGEFKEAVPYGSHNDLALMAGDVSWLFRDEVAHNRLSGEVLYRTGDTRSLLTQMTRDATQDGSTGQGFEATR